MKTTDTTSTTLVEAALRYASRGWQVIPLHSFVGGVCTCEKTDCGSPAKHPLTLRGVHDATTDVETIRRWWDETQGMANVGIATGRPSGLVVVDVDAKHGGLETLARLQQTHGPLPTTPAVATGGGGMHYYFRYPAGMTIGNRAGASPGVDVRGDDGYVVAPPSIHASSNHYAWTLPPETTPLADLPPWLLDLILAKEGVVVARGTPGLVVTVQPAMDDLASHPGVGNGQRHDTLCRLVGTHLARGDDPEEIRVSALAWAERCSPPLPEAEVVRTVESLAQKHQRSITVVCPAGEVEFENLALPQQPVWPTLDQAAYHGVVGEIVRTIEPQSEADPVGILLSLLLCCGSAMGRKPYYQVEGDKHHTNLFAVIVGDSSRGRKGTSLGRTLSLIGGVDAAWLQNCISTGLSSGEGLIWAVRDRIETLEPVKEKGKIVGYQPVIRDHGVEDKRLLVTESEFAQTLRVLRREGNTLSPIIRSAWDRGDLKVLTKNNQAQATDAHVSILGHITRPELREYLSETDLFNGFANRFLWALVRRSKLLPDGGGELDLEPLQGRLGTSCAQAMQIERMERSAAAKSLWHSVYLDLTAERSGLYGAATGRGEAQVLRLSMIYALLDGAAVIEVWHLQAAAALWRYCDASAKIIFGHADEDPLQNLLLETIRTNPGINRKGLYRASGGHLPATAMLQALAAIRDRDLVQCQLVATGGRPAECWFPCERTNKVSPSSISAEASDVCERTNKVHPGGSEGKEDCEQTNKGGCAQAATLSSFARTGSAEADGSASDTACEETNKAPPADEPRLCSFARTAPAVAVPTPALAPDPIAGGSVMSVADLFHAVNQIGGRLVRHGEAMTVDAPQGEVPLAVKDALAAHHATLLALFPATNTVAAMSSPATTTDRDRVISKEEFMAEIEAMPMTPDVERLFEELRSGV